MPGVSRGSATGSSALEPQRQLARPHRERVVVLVVLRRARAQLGRSLVEREGHDPRRPQLDLRRGAHRGEPPGHDVLHDRVERPRLLRRVPDLTRRAQHQDAAVVHRVVEGGAREHQAVEQRDRQATRRTGAEERQHPARGRAVDHHLVADAREGRGNHERLALVHEAHVADEGLVEDGVDRGAIVVAALRQAPHGGSRRGPARLPSNRRRRPRPRRHADAWGWSCAPASTRASA